jgi:hypothetical protein
MADRKLTPEQIRLIVLLVALLVVAGFAVSRLIRHGGLAGQDQDLARTTYEARDLPHLAEISAWQNEETDAVTSRNPFTFGAPPTPTRNLTPAPTRPPMPTRPPQPTPTPRTFRGTDGQVKGPPPPFDREYIGFFGPPTLKVAAFRRQGSVPEVTEIDVGIEGEVLDDVFIIREIGLESVRIGFVGYDSSEDTRVPLADD